MGFSGRPGLEDYVFNSTAPRNRSAAPGPADGTGLVESGAFRVDRAKALEKLSGFQLNDPAAFLLPWLRCAVASGASRVEVLDTGRGLEMRFDGRPLDRRAVDDPLSAFFDEEGPDSERGRHLAAGLLAALRLAPRSVTVISGVGANRARLDAARRGSGEPPAAADAGADTVLRARLPRLQARTCASALSDGFGLSSVRLRVLGRLIADRPRASLPTHTFRRGELSGFLMLPEPAAGDSEVRLYKQGALVRRMRMSLSVAQVQAWLGDDRFRLDISQSGVIQGGGLSEALDALGDESLTFLKSLAREHSLRWPAMTRALIGSVASVDLWRALTGDVWATPLSRAVLRLLCGLLAAPKVPELAEWDTRVTRYLRQALALRGDSRKADWNHPLWRQLAAVPVFLDVDGEPLSCQAVWWLQGDARRLPISERALLGKRSRGPKAVWCPRRVDKECLRTLFPDEKP